MPDKSERFAAGNRRLVLVADDELINREILGNMLEDSYEVLYASDGADAIKVIREHVKSLSLVLLDLLMPKVSGMDVLRTMKGDEELQRIPVIVCTSENSAEVECLNLGAIDFISKPYSQPEVILARIQRTIELSEDRQIIQVTERDSLTGLYTRDYFYRYAEQFDQLHRDAPMDAVIIDVNHFHILNERYGKAYGDRVLVNIGERLDEAFSGEGGIVCRLKDDTFMVYCLHRESYRDVMDSVSRDLTGDDGLSGNRVRLRMGVYPHADKSIDVERRFDRAKMAADTVRNNYSQSIALYDNALHRAELFSEQLLEGFQEAIAQRQFKVFYQPKFDIRSDIPSLSSAEALVRWQHPVLGLISPGIFIPLFEENSLVQQLDMYVWRETAAQIRDWRERFGISVPVSVNVSRIDMYDPGLIDTFKGIMEEFSLTPDELLLEITESAYTQDSTQIIDTINNLRSLGFRIEMDDFGTGYSSLSMISSLPIDALKLDMQFIHNAFNERRDIHMLELIIDIAEYLGVPTIAEGVETDEQLAALKRMGCDIVQGYYFSRPVPAEEYERFVAEKRDLQNIPEGVGPQGAVERPKERYVSYVNIAHALSNGFDSIYYVDTETDRFVQFSSRGRDEDLQIERSGGDFFDTVRRNLVTAVHPEDADRVEASIRKDALLDRLSGNSSFSITYRLMLDDAPVYYNLKAARATGRDDHHIVVGISNVDELKRHEREYEAAKEASETYSRIARALAQDFYRIYYVNTDTDDYIEYDSGDENGELSAVKRGTDFFNAAKSAAGEVYAPDSEKADEIWDKKSMLRALGDASSFISSYRLMKDGQPVYISVKAMRMTDDDSGHVVIGLSNVDAQMKRELEFAEARDQALKDALTGIRNKRAYGQLEQRINSDIERGEAAPFAVVVCDINCLKNVNDTLGHKAGDQYIKDACSLICHVFDHSPVFRIGGDEFVAVLSGDDYKNRSALMAELSRKSGKNCDSGVVSVAGGISEYVPGADSSVAEVFERADGDMYKNKAAAKAV